MAKHVKHRMSKHEMKEDKFVSSVMDGAVYARENIQNVVIIVLAVVVLVAAAIIWKTTSAGKQETAKTKLGIAQISYKLENYSEARDSLLSLTNNYSKTKPAKVGLYLLGHIYFATGNPDSSKIYWGRFLECGMDDRDMIAGAKSGLAGIMSDARQYSEAADAFEKIYRDYPGYFNRTDLLYLAAHNYQAAGNNDRARDLFAEFIRDYEDSPKAITARLVLAELTAK